MNDELRPEYQFDYSKAKPNRFAAGLKKGGRVVVLDPEVAEVFRTSEDVNAVLRALLQTMPPSGGKSESAAPGGVEH
jgi:hypothetical protein